MSLRCWLSCTEIILSRQSNSIRRSGSRIIRKKKHIKIRLVSSPKLKYLVQNILIILFNSYLKS